MQNLGIWGLIGTGVKNRRRKVECTIFGIADPDSYSLSNFYGTTMMIKGSLLLSILGRNKYSVAEAMSH